MKTTEQGVRHLSGLIRLLIHTLLLVCISPAVPSIAETTPGNSGATAVQTIPVVSVIYSTQSRLQKNISLELLQQLSSEPLPSRTPVQTRLVQADNRPELAEETRSNTRLVVVVGGDNLAYAKHTFPETPFLVLLTDPGKPARKTLRAEDSILYMTQPVCRQLAFIHLLNPQWKSFGYLTSRTDYPDRKKMQSCAAKHAMRAYSQYSNNIEELSNDLKHALRKTDLLLALPDRNIYNRRTVKNILLTSYRLRKPVIAFSASFVNAGAIASIHSSPKQISRAASRLIAEELSGNRRFGHRINYPDEFDININRQVFKALNIDIPDIRTLKRRLNSAASAHPISSDEGASK